MVKQMIAGLAAVIISFTGAISVTAAATHKTANQQVSEPFFQSEEAKAWKKVKAALDAGKTQVEYQFSKKVDQQTVGLLYDRIMNRAKYDCPEKFIDRVKIQFWWEGTPNSYYKIQFTFEPYPLTAQQKQQTLDEADRIVKQATGTDVEKLRFFHDTIIDRCAYDKEGYPDPDDTHYADYTAYGALVAGKAVCEGYTKAFTLLCNQAGIPCWTVVGVTDVPHAWNYVKLDGNYYMVDTTLDDTWVQENRHKYFLAGADVQAERHNVSGVTPGQLYPTYYAPGQGVPEAEPQQEAEEQQEETQAEKTEESKSTGKKVIKKKSQAQ